MNQLTEFVTNHAALCALFVFLLVMAIAYELIMRARAMPRLTVQQAVNFINHKNAMIVDLRDKAAFNEGHIANARNIFYAELEADSTKLGKDKDAPIILACAAGLQSNKTGQLLRQQGYTQIFILSGGIAAWKSDNLLLVKK